MRARAAIPVVSVVLGCLGLGIWHCTARHRDINSHLKSLEFWQRRQFGKSAWTDLFRWQAWSGPRADPGKEEAKEYDALVALAYFTNRSFVLSTLMTNRVDSWSLQQKVRGTRFSDAHWKYSLVSNRIDAVIAVRDLPVWEEIIRTWEAQRLGPQQPDGAANGSQPIRTETNSTSSAAGSRR